MRRYEFLLGCLVVVYIISVISTVVWGAYGLVQMNQVSYECLSYGYPQYRIASGSNPAYCIRRVFETDEVRTLEELRKR